MDVEVCPECAGPLELRRVSPCLACGGDQDEVEHHLTGLHGYAEYEPFDGLPLVLCNYCAVDFPSRDPAQFGLPPEPALEREALRLRGRLERPELAEDRYCPACNERLAFLLYLAAARQQHARRR